MDQIKINKGSATIRDTGVKVGLILMHLSVGDRRETILKAYPLLREEDIFECLEFASKLITQIYD